MVEVDVVAVVDLCTRLLPGMVERGRGAILNVASHRGVPAAARPGGVRRRQGLRPLLHPVAGRRAQGQRRHRDRALPGAGATPASASAPGFTKEEAEKALPVGDVGRRRRGRQGRGRRARQGPDGRHPRRRQPGRRRARPGHPAHAAAPGAADASRPRSSPGTERRHALGSARRPARLRPGHRGPRRRHAPGARARRGAAGQRPAAGAPTSHRARPRPSGKGGAVTSVDPYASRIGLQVLKQGGNAVDAAVATAAALGVTEPYSAGLGGGGYFVYYDAKTRRCRRIDGRETAPAAMKHDAFIDPETGKPYNFTPELVTSGVSVGVPGTPATWQRALDRWGTRCRSATSLRAGGRPGPPRLRGRQDLQRSRPTTTPSGSRPSPRPASCSCGTARRPRSAARFRNPRPRRHLRPARRAGHRARSTAARSGRRDRPSRAQAPDDEAAPTLPVPEGLDAAKRPRERYRGRPAPAHPRRLPRPRRLRHGAVLVSGGSTVGEALNILERYDLDVAARRAQAQHLYLEASAPRLRRPRQVRRRPSRSTSRSTRLLSDTYAAERACQIDPRTRSRQPVAAGDVASYDGSCATPEQQGRGRRRTPRTSTPPTSPSPTSGATSSSTRSPSSRPAAPGSCVPGRGFLLNNELTDFSAVYDPADPNRIEPRQAAAQLDVADDRAQGRQAVPRRRVARRLDDHHHGARRSWSTGSTSA